MQLSISTESILKQLYALSSLRSYLTSTPSVVDPFLSEDNREGLIPVLQEALSHVMVDIMPHLQIITPPNSIDDLIEIELNVVNLPSGTDKVMESAIVERMLQILYAPISETISRQFAEMAQRSASTLHTIITNCAIDSTTLTVRWNGY